MNNNTPSYSGTLFGIGVGPGAPDLLTLRAVETLRRVEVILAAASPRNDYSLALSIAAPHLPPGIATTRLDFPMTRDADALAAAWEANAHTTAALLRSGKNAAFLTLGDPLLYSTFGYLMRTLARLYPEIPVEVVPGITSFQEAAAKTRTVLCEGEESLILVSGVTGENRLRAALEAAESAVILKAYRNAPTIRSVLAALGKDGESFFISRLGLPGEMRKHGLDSMPEKPDYLSLILAPPTRKKRGTHADTF